MSDKTRIIQLSKHDAYASDATPVKCQVRVSSMTRQFCFSRLCCIADPSLLPSQYGGALTKIIDGIRGHIDPFFNSPQVHPLSPCLFYPQPNTPFNNYNQVLDHLSLNDHPFLMFCPILQFFSICSLKMCPNLYFLLNDPPIWRKFSRKDLQF